MFKTLRRLFPFGRAWAFFKDSTLSKFTAGLANLGTDFKVYADQNWLRIFPDTTDKLDEWDQQFGLAEAPELTEQERRDRLASRWAAFGGQSVSYIKDTLDAAGFTDLLVYEWFIAGTDPLESRDPVFITDGGSIQCGDPEDQCGDPEAQCGGGEPATGYALVNNAQDDATYIVRSEVPASEAYQCGDPEAQCGDPAVDCGTDQLPSDVRPYYLYISGASFGDVVQLPAARRSELEALLLKICPTHLWIILTVEYI